MNRYKVTNKIIKPSLRLYFENLNNPSICKEVIITEGDLISLVKAPNKVYVLEPITKQDILDKMIYRGRIVSIERERVPKYLRLGHYQHDYDYYANRLNGEMTYIVLDTSKDGQGSIIRIAVDDYLLDINEVDYEYKLDEPLPVESQALVIAKDKDPIKDCVVYHKPIVYYRQKDIEKEDDKNE